MPNLTVRILARQIGKSLLASMAFALLLTTAAAAQSVTTTTPMGVPVDGEARYIPDSCGDNATCPVGTTCLPGGVAREADTAVVTRPIIHHFVVYGRRCSAPATVHVSPPTQVLANTDMPGSDYNRFTPTPSNPETCRLACVAQTQCRAWTYVGPGVQGPNALCYLKNTIPPPKPDGCCTSGVK